MQYTEKRYKDLLRRYNNLVVTSDRLQVENNNLQGKISELENLLQGADTRVHIQKKAMVDSIVQGRKVHDGLVAEIKTLREKLVVRA